MTDADAADGLTFPPFLRAVMDDAESVLAMARARPECLSGLIETDASQAQFLPLFTPQSIAAAVLDGQGGVKAASRLFAEEHGERYIDPAWLTAPSGSASPSPRPSPWSGRTGRNPSSSFTHRRRWRFRFGTCHWGWRTRPLTARSWW